MERVLHTIIESLSVKMSDPSTYGTSTADDHIILAKLIMVTCCVVIIARSVVTASRKEN